ncbi:hypothetical protein BpHYR1_036402, partial [Brachionus plicatilis]
MKELDVKELDMRKRCEKSLSTGLRLKGSTKQQGEEIGELIESQYLPEMPALFQKADREKQQWLQSKHVMSLSENECD